MERTASVEDMVGNLWRMGRTPSAAEFEQFFSNIAQVGSQPSARPRGLTPATWTQISLPPGEPDILVHSHGEFPADADTIVGAGDALGGNYSAQARIRRVSLAYIVFQSFDIANPDPDPESRIVKHSCTF
jgi:hypothetical protein